MRESMSSTQPAPADRQLPRSHLLALNRSFRCALEAENKSPRTMQAYTDAVRLLASYCQVHGQPLLVGEPRREHLARLLTDLVMGPTNGKGGPSLCRCVRRPRPASPLRRWTTIRALVPAAAWPVDDQAAQRGS
jgi:hypothetical protein